MSSVSPASPGSTLLSPVQKDALVVTSYWQKHLDESNLTFFLQAHDRVMRDIKALRSSESRQVFKNLRAISTAVVENGGVVSTHPLGF